MIFKGKISKINIKNSSNKLFTLEEQVHQTSQLNHFVAEVLEVEEEELELA